MAALFASSASSRNQSKNLVEFRAGKMHMKGKMVHADKRKGLVYVYQSDDSLMHFCWKDRSSGSVEDDLIIFPDDIEFKHVSQCTTGRVYVLKFKSSSRKFFFWLQEPKVDKDEEYCKKVNDFLNNPPTPGSSRGGGGLPSDLTSLGDQDLQSILGGMSQQQLMQLLGGINMGGGPASGVLSSLMGRPPSSQSMASEPPPRSQSSSGPRATAAESTPLAPRPVTAAALPTQPPAREAPRTTATAATTNAAPLPVPASSSSGGASAQIQLSDLQNILSTMKVPSDGAGKEAVDLAKALSPETMIPILANPEVQERLIPFLPEGESLPKTEQELRNTVQSPQFQQALSSFSSALQSGQLGPLMSQFGLGEDVANAAAQGDGPCSQFADNDQFVNALREISSVSDLVDEEATLDDVEFDVAPPGSLLWLDDARDITTIQIILEQLSYIKDKEVEKEDDDSSEAKAQPALSELDEAVNPSITKQQENNLEIHTSVVTNELSVSHLQEIGTKHAIDDVQYELTIDSLVELNSDEKLRAEPVGLKSEVCEAGYYKSAADNVESHDSNQDDRPVCFTVESLDNLKTNLSEVVHLEPSTDTNCDDRHAVQGILGFDHLQQGVSGSASAPSLQCPEHHQNMTVALSVSKTDARKQSATNLKFDIETGQVSIHLQISDAEQVLCDKTLAMQSLVNSQPQGQHNVNSVCNEAVALDEADFVRIDKVETLDEDMAPKDTILSLTNWIPCHDSWAGIVNPGFNPEDDDNEAVSVAKHWTSMQPQEWWYSESREEPLEASSYNSGLPELHIDENCTDMGDTNKDAREVEILEKDQEEMDVIMCSDAEPKDDTIDTNEDIRPVVENMAAFDHLLGNVKVDHQSKSSTFIGAQSIHSDINLHLNVVYTSLNVDIAIKTPSCIFKESISIPPVSDDVHAHLNVEQPNPDPNATEISKSTHSASHKLPDHQVAVLYQELKNKAKHLYLDELYVYDDTEDSSSQSDPSNDSSNASVCTAKHILTHKRSEQRSDAGVPLDTTKVIGSSVKDLSNDDQVLASVLNVDQPNKAEVQGVEFKEFLENLDSDFKLSTLTKRNKLVSSEGGEVIVLAARNNRTLARSTHLPLEPDISIQETLAVSSYPEVERFTATKIEGSKVSQPASGGCKVDMSESEGHLSFRWSHQAEFNDVVACGLSCMDMVFWVCLAIAIIMYELLQFQ